MTTYMPGKTGRAVRGFAYLDYMDMTAGELARFSQFGDLDARDELHRRGLSHVGLLDTGVVVRACDNDGNVVGPALRYEWVESGERRGHWLGPWAYCGAAVVRICSDGSALNGMMVSRPRVAPAESQSSRNLR